MINLTAEEIRDITGLTMPRKQCAWLRENGFVFKIRADGYPLVARSHFLQTMGVDLSKGSSNDGISNEIEPDFSQA